MVQYIIDQTLFLYVINYYSISRRNEFSGFPVHGRTILHVCVEEIMHHACSQSRRGKIYLPLDQIIMVEIN